MDKNEIRDWIIENCKNENGDIDLSGLDFSEFGWDVYIGHMKVKHDLHQGSQTAGGSIYQGYQTVDGSIWQDFQNAKCDIFQNYQTAHWMRLQDTTNMEKSENGYWEKKKTLEERVDELDIDADLKKEIIGKIKEAGK